jgi:hypothetical protein
MPLGQQRIPICIEADFGGKKNDICAILVADYIAGIDPGRATDTGARNTTSRGRTAAPDRDQDLWQMV